MNGRTAHTIGGKATVLTTLIGVGILFAGLLIDLPSGSIARANVATTSVTVLNTPPTFVQNPQEMPGSSTSTPTNSGSSVTWATVATDSSGDNYYLLICKTSATPTPNPSAAPSCAGGLANRWAVSAQTTSGAQATAATTTLEAFAEFNDWYAWVCDHNGNGPACSSPAMSGNGTTSSPFVVNHRPTFSIFIDDSPKNPGQTVTWYSTSSDPDTYQGTATDTVKLFVCKAADFTGTACGPGGTWATSSYVTQDASSTFVLENPKPDGVYAAYGYVVDSHGNHQPSGGAHGSNSVLIVNNMSPSIAAASISLLDVDRTGPLVLTNPAGQTTGFQVEFTVTDQNSCQNLSATNEIASSSIDVFRSGVGSTTCQLAGSFDANNCYPDAVATTTWNPVCTASSTSCLGISDSDQIWTCTFPLWYVAEATDGDGVPATDPPNFAENWLTTALAFDDNSSSTGRIEASSGNELNSFLAYLVATTSIHYGGLQPGFANDPIDRITDLKAAGNVGLDQTLYGTDMCPTYPTCSGNATSTIFVTDQKYATSSLAYASSVSLLSNPGAEVEINVPKSTSTTVQAERNTFWGVLVPGAITVSGTYTGVNTLIGITGERANW